MGRISATQIIILVVIVLLLFGANRLPGLAKSVGQSLKIFKSEVKDLRDDGDSSKAKDGTTPADDRPEAPTTEGTTPPKV